MQKLSLNVLLFLLAFVSWSGVAQAATVTVSSTGAGTGFITSNAGTPLLSCGTTCTTIAANGSVTLTAAANTGSQFISWVNATGDAIRCANSTASTCTFNSTTATSITAVFVQTTVTSYNLTTIKQGSGSDYGLVTSTPTGIDCGAGVNGGSTDCSEIYSPGQRVTLKAAADPNATGKNVFFGGWEVYFFIQGEFKRQADLCVGLEPTCNLTMAYETQVRAKFDFNYILLLSRQGEGAGSLLTTSGNLQNVCLDTSCSQTYTPSSTVTVTAVPTVNSKFAGWIVDGNSTTCSASSTTCALNMTGPHSVVAKFDKVLSGSVTATLLKQGSGSGYGTVRSTPVGINCGPSATDCSATFNRNNGVSFDATSTTPGVFFSGWEVWYLDDTQVPPKWKQEPNMCTGLTPKCDVTMTQDVRIMSRFDYDLSLTVVRDGNGTGSIISTSAALNKCTVDGAKSAICSQTFVQNQSVTLTAVPDLKSRFIKWQGCDTMKDDNLDGAQEVCLVQMSQAKLVTATFEAIDSAKLSVTKDPTGTGTGTVKSDVQGLLCGTICNRNYAFNTTVVLTAIPDPGSEFGGWGGDWCSGQELTCTVNMTQAKDVVAIFNKGFKLTLDKQGSGQGTVISNPTGINCGASCVMSYPANTVVQLTASTIDGSTFLGWGGDCSGTQLTCSVTLTAARNVTVSFSGVSLGKALDNTALTWSTAGDVPWVGQFTQFYYGQSAAETGSIKHGQESTIKTQVTGPGKLKFWWKVSSEINDKLSFEAINTTSNQSTNFVAISGNVDWTQKTIDIPTGSYNLKWSYTKDADITQGSDKGWLDRVEFSSGGNSLSVVRQGTGTGFGSVTSVPAGINCGEACNMSFGENGVIKLIANPIGGSEFGGWSGDGACVGLSTTCVVAANQSHLVVATFNLNTTIVANAALQLGLLNDTGIDWCATNSSLYLSNRANQCDVVLKDAFPNQDGQTGRDAAFRSGQLNVKTHKVGAGDAGFDYSKICNNGAVAGQGNCPSAPVIGPGDNQWGCTRDNISKLIWELKTDDNLHSPNATYSWFVPDDQLNGGSKGDNCINDQCNTDLLVQEINTAGLCGANDWRLPTRRELQSIVHHGQSKPAIDISYFPDHTSGSFWTATPSASSAFNAWYVNFDTGWNFWDNKSNKYHVRLVRNCDNCTSLTPAPNPVYRNANLEIPEVNVENTYYQANLVQINANPLTFQLKSAQRTNTTISSRANKIDPARFYASGMLILGGVRVGDAHYNAMLQLIEGSNPMQFVLKEAHAMP